jgi:hypothetical protein
MLELEQAVALVAERRAGGRLPALRATRSLLVLARVLPVHRPTHTAARRCLSRTCAR